MTFSTGTPPSSDLRTRLTRVAFSSWPFTCVSPPARRRRAPRERDPERASARARNSDARSARASASTPPVADPAPAPRLSSPAIWQRETESCFRRHARARDDVRSRFFLAKSKAPPSRRRARARPDPSLRPPDPPSLADAVPPRLPVQAPEGELQDEGVPPERELAGEHLPGHPEGAVVARAHHLQGAALHLLAAHGPEPGRPARARDRADLQNRPGAVQRARQGVDQEVRHVESRAGGWRREGFFLPITRDGL